MAESTVHAAPHFHIYPRPRRVRGHQLIPAPELPAATIHDGVLWPVEAREVFSVLGHHYYLVRDHATDQENPTGWRVVLACGIGVGAVHSTPAQAVQACMEVIRNYVTTHGTEAYADLVIKAKERCRGAAVPLPAVYLRPCRV